MPVTFTTAGSERYIDTHLTPRGIQQCKEARTGLSHSARDTTAHRKPQTSACHACFTLPCLRIVCANAILSHTHILHGAHKHKHALTHSRPGILLEGINPQVVIVSPFTRALQTAHLMFAAKGIPFIVHDSARERWGLVSDDPSSFELHFMSHSHMHTALHCTGRPLTMKDAKSFTCVFNVDIMSQSHESHAYSVIIPSHP